jgi:hypothetical protein
MSPDRIEIITLDDILFNECYSAQDLCTIHHAPPVVLQQTNSYPNPSRKRSIAHGSSGSIADEFSVDCYQNLKRAKYSAVSNPPPFISCVNLMRNNHFICQEDLSSSIKSVSRALLKREKVYFHYVNSQHSFYIFYMKGSYFTRMKIHFFSLLKEEKEEPQTGILKNENNRSTLVVAGLFEEGEKDLYYELFHLIKDVLTLPMAQIEENIQEQANPGNTYSSETEITGNLSRLSLSPPASFVYPKNITKDLEFYSQNKLIVSHWIDTMSNSSTCGSCRSPNNKITLSYEERLNALRPLFNLTVDRQNERMLLFLEELGIVSALIDCFHNEFCDSYQQIGKNKSAVNKNCPFAFSFFPIPVDFGSQQRKAFQYLLLMTISNFACQEQAMKQFVKQDKLIQLLTSLGNNYVELANGSVFGEDSCFQSLQLIPVRESCHFLLSKILLSLSVTATLTECSEHISLSPLVVRVKG